MKDIKLTDEEKKALIRALDYFRREEEKEIMELSLPSGNKDFIKNCERRLKIYKSLITKLSDL